MNPFAHPFLLLILAAVWLLARKLNTAYGNRLIGDLLRESEKLQNQPLSFIGETEAAQSGRNASPPRQAPATEMRDAAPREVKGEMASAPSEDPLPAPNAAESKKRPALAWTCLLVFALLLAASSVLYARYRSPSALQLKGTVVKVLDGDTLDLLDATGRTVRVRLYGIDCPEEGQPFGTEAKQLATALAYRKEARVTVMDRDGYGRLVGVVYVGRTDVNRELARKGLAWAYRAYSDRYATEEEQARRKKRGLWGDSQPIAPWEWRPMMKSPRYRGFN